MVDAVDMVGEGVRTTVETANGERGLVELHLSQLRHCSTVWDVRRDDVRRARSILDGGNRGEQLFSYCLPSTFPTLSSDSCDFSVPC